MKYKYLRGYGAYSYLDFNFTFIEYVGGVTLILGKDLNTKTANGAGKSSLLKILYYGSYGKELNNATKSQIKNRNSKHGMLIETGIEDNGHEFLIQRFEGRPELQDKGKEGLNFFIDGELFMGTSKGDGIEEVQNAINIKLKISPKLFLSSVLSRQRGTEDFFSAGDTKKKEILSEILDLQAYEKAFKYVKEEITKIKDRKEIKDKRVSENKKQIEVLDEQDIELKEKEANFAEEVKKDITDLEAKLSQERSKYKKTQAQLIKVLNSEDIKKEIEENKQFLKDNEKEIEEERKISNDLNKAQLELKTNLDNLKREEQSLIDLSNRKANLNLTKINVTLEIETLEKEAKLVEQAILKIDDFKNQLSDLKLKDNSANNVLSNLNEKIKDKEKQIHEFENSTICPTCLRPYDKTDKAHQEEIEQKIKDLKSEVVSLNLNVEEKNKEILALQEDITKLNLEIGKLADLKESFGILNEAASILRSQALVENVITTIKNDHVILTEAVNSYTEALNKVLAIKQKYDAANNKINSLEKDLINNDNHIKQNEKVKEALETIQENGDALKQQIENLKVKKNTYTELIETNSKKRKGILVTIQQTEDSIAKDDDELKYLNFWLVGFSPTGIRSFITDDVIELLNRKVQEHLNELSSGTLSVVYEPQSEDKKGVSSNKISTTIFLNGKQTVPETISGGETQRAILATNLALTEVAEARSGVQLNVRFLDEPFEGLDSVAQQLAFRLFNKLAKNKDGFFIISHDENFQNMCSNVIYILKEDEISRMVTKEEFNQTTISDESAILNETEHFEDTGQVSASFAQKLKELAKKKK